jgi:N-acetylneuraminic acid mutarotase
MKKHFPYFFRQSQLSFIFKFHFTFIALVFLKYYSLAQDFTTISWGTAKSQPLGTHEIHGEVVNGKLYIFGGYDVNKRPNWTPTKRSYVFDPIANIWTAIADLPHTPNGSGFGGITHEGLTNDGTNIYFAGGYTSNSNGTGQIFGTKQVWRYNVASNNYTRLPDLPQALAAGQMRYLNGKLHYIGGANYSRSDVSIHYALDLNNLSAGWKALAPLLNPVNHPGSAVYGGKIYYIGGSHHQDNNSVVQKTLQVYSPNTNTWTKLADMRVGRDHISSAVVVMGTRILVLGGETSHNVLSNLVSAYSPATNTWTELTPLTAGKSAGVAAILNGNIYYTGGNFSNINRKGTPGSQNATTNLLPLADAFVRSGSFATKNYGSDTSLIVKGSIVSGYSRTSYLKFSLSSVSKVSYAKLRIYGRNIDNTKSINLSIYGLTNDSWTESGITFNNAPVAATSALSSVSVNDQPKYYELDVTNFVKSQFAGDKMVSLLIKDASNQNSRVRFNSKDNVKNKPQLIISSSASRTTAEVIQVTRSGEDAFNSERNLKKPVIYPNPLRKTFNIKFPENYEGNFALGMVDQSGRIYNIGKIVVYRGGPSINVDISRLSLVAGVYFLTITSDTTSDEIKLIVQ